MTEIKNVQEKDNLLFNRKEIKIDVGAEITPSREEALKIVCEKFSCASEVIKIIRIGSNFGTKVFTIVADIYGSKEVKTSIAIKRKKELEAEKKVEEEKKKAAEVVEEKPAEQPVETVEEKPAEKVSEQESESKAEEKKE